MILLIEQIFRILDFHKKIKILSHAVVHGGYLIYVTKKNVKYNVCVCCVIKLN